jgi:acetoin utilization protein AcuB
MPASDTKLTELMTRQLVTVRMDDSLSRIRELFDAHQFHHVLVVEEHKLVGVISDRDLLHHISPFIGHDFSERKQDLATLNKRAHQVMSRRLLTATPQTTVADATRMILAYQISCLPVIDEHSRPLGIVTWRDLLRALTPPQVAEAA